MRTYVGIGVVVALLFATLSPLVATVDARTVHSVSNHGLISSAPFEDSADWTLTTRSGFTNTPADHTSAMVTDGHLSFTHHLPLNSQESDLWANTNSTENHAYATGSPDGGLVWSTGPEITVGDFDISGVTGNDLLSAELVVAFRIPDALQQDSVRITLEWNGNNALVREYAHTQSGIEKFNYPYGTYDLSSFANWTWSDIADLWVTIDYVSVGGTDDSRVEVDAVAIRTSYRSQWFGLESALGEMTVSGDWPIVDLDMSTGTHEGIAQTPCGLELASGETFGTWTSEPLERPALQDWGRLNDTGAWLGDLKVRSSSDGQGWSNWFLVSSGEQMPNLPWIQILVDMSGGCVESLRVDVNDPTISIDWQLQGDLSGLVLNASWFQAAIDGELVFKQNFTTSGVFTSTLPVGQFLPEQGEDMEIVFAAVFNWASDGTTRTSLVQVDGVQISGGFEVEWDEDPVCMGIADEYLMEDGAGRLIPILPTCSDDRTATANLGISVSMDRTDIVEVDVVGDQLRIRLLAEASGVTNISVTVMDAVGNTWSDEFIVDVETVNDAPVINSLPTLIIIPHGEAYRQALTFQDIDDDTPSLVVSASYTWATWDSSTGDLVLSPPQPGTFDLEVSVSDGDLTAIRHMSVEVRALADLLVEDIIVIGEVIEGEEVEIQVYIRNIGQAAAYLVEVRCEVDGQLIGATTMAELAPGTVHTASFQWLIPHGDDAVLISAIADKGNDVDESVEDNNEGSTLVDIQKSPEPSSGISDVISVSSGTLWGGTVILLLFLIGLFALLGPAPIKKLK